ncbi:MAG TPA: phosphoesterase [Epulopiscium sp.]|nr:phosphoesterase [Candidatus Epulonipiscium sp.]
MQKGNKPFLYLAWMIRFIQGTVFCGVIYSIAAISTNTMLGIVGVILFLSLFISSFYVLRQTEIKILENINERLITVGETRKEIFIRSALPMVTMNMQGEIWWYNTSFKKMTQYKNILDTNIRSILPEVQIEDFPKDNRIMEKDITIDGSSYTMYSELAKLGDEGSKDYNYVVYFIDKTELIHLEKQIKDKRCMVGIICIDNYAEIEQNVDDVKRPMLMALIDRKVHRWLQDEDVVVRRFERDKYMLIFSYELLATIEATKFSILDEMRKVQMGNELPVTMSIGIGININSLAGSMDEAKAALDLALGRGGDQAVIKNQDKYTFYGGKTKEVEISTRVKARMKAYAFKELIQQSDNLIIMGHKNMDMDCLGAAMGVYRVAAMLGKKAQIVLEEPTMAIQMLYNRIIESKDYDDLFITSQEAGYQLDNQTLLVIVDVHRSNYVEDPTLLEMAEKVVVFDHHRRSTDYIDNAVLTYYESYISSTCEMIAEILQYIGEKVKLTNIEADALLAGITVDTKNFIFKTGVRTFEAAAFLRRNGADSTRVRMFFQSDMASYKARAIALKGAEIYQDTIAIANVESDIENGFIIAAQTADELLNIRGITASFAMVQVDKVIAISARSHGDLNVQVIMEMIGGGGHQTVAGMQLEGKTIEEANELLKKAINDYFKEGE